MQCLRRPVGSLVCARRYTFLQVSFTQGLSCHHWLTSVYQLNWCVVPTVACRVACLCKMLLVFTGWPKSQTTHTFKACSLCHQISALLSENKCNFVLSVGYVHHVQKFMHLLAYSCLGQPGRDIILDAENVKLTFTIILTFSDCSCIHCLLKPPPKLRQRIRSPLITN
jgi:hypothetical protein